MLMEVLYLLTITLSDELEARLKQRAVEQGEPVEALAATLLDEALDWDARDRSEAIDGIRRGLEAGEAGRVLPASEVFAAMRERLTQHNQ
jgi:predicted transcriptional regulator